LPQISENRLKGAPVAMNVRYYGDSHVVCDPRETPGYPDAQKRITTPLPRSQ
jgi:hypothetical protein